MNGKLISTNIQRWRYVVMDLITSAVAFFVFNIFRFHLMDGQHFVESMLNPKVVIEQIVIPFGLIGLYWLSGYYNHPFNRSRLQEFSTTFFTALVTALIIYFAMLINDQLPTRFLNYELFLAMILIFFVCVYTGRIILTMSSVRRFKRKEWSFNTVVIGNSDEAMRIADKLQKQQTNLGINVIGHIAIMGEKSSRKSHKTLTKAQFDELIKTQKVDQLFIVADRGSSEEKVLMLLYDYFQYGLPIKIAPTSLSFLTSNIRLQDIYAEPFIDLTQPAMTDSEVNIKRVLDVVISSLALLIGLPVYAAVALAVKLSSDGPVIYSQERIGLRHKPFKIYKFRSMLVDAEADGPQLSDDSDPRITKTGHIMRKYRLDELPQFWNVLKGDMSIVGPRPEREYYINQIVRLAPYYTLVHQVKPGLTSWGMVKFGYARTVEEMVERTRYDLIYLSNMSVLVDFKILIHTIKTVVNGEGK